MLSSLSLVVLSVSIETEQNVLTSDERLCSTLNPPTIYVTGMIIAVLTRCRANEPIPHKITLPLLTSVLILFTHLCQDLLSVFFQSVFSHENFVRISQVSHSSLIPCGSPHHPKSGEGTRHKIPAPRHVLAAPSTTARPASFYSRERFSLLRHFNHLYIPYFLAK